MTIITWILLAISLVELAALVLVCKAFARVKREGRALDPVDVLPITPHPRQKDDGGWVVIDDPIQYDDDERAEFYRGAFVS